MHLPKEVRKNMRFACNHPGCNASLATNFSLELHTRTHSKERPYACSCGARFKLNQILKQHIKKANDPLKHQPISTSTQVNTEETPLVFAESTTSPISAQSVAPTLVVQEEKKNEAPVSLQAKEQQYITLNTTNSVLKKMEINPCERTISEASSDNLFSWNLYLSNREFFIILDARKEEFNYTETLPSINNTSLEELQEKIGYLQEILEKGVFSIENFQSQIGLTLLEMKELNPKSFGFLYNKPLSDLKFVIFALSCLPVYNYQDLGGTYCNRDFLKRFWKAIHLENSHSFTLFKNKRKRDEVITIDDEQSSNIVPKHSTRGHR